MVASRYGRSAASMRQTTVHAGNVLTGFRMKTALNYVTSFTMNRTGGSAPLVRHFRLNSIWDPDVTVTTGQTSAYGWTVMNELYRKYCVVGVKVKLMMQDTFTTPTRIVVLPSDVQMGASDLNNFNAIQGYQGAKSYLTGNVNANKTIVYTKYISLAQINGQAIRLSDARYQTLMNQDPVDRSYLNIAQIAHDPSQSSLVNCQLHMKFYTIFSEPVKLGLFKQLNLDQQNDDDDPHTYVPEDPDTEPE